MLKELRDTYGDQVVLLCFPTRDYMGQEFKTGAEVKAFALQRVPEGLTILEVAPLKERKGWVFPIPNWNFSGKYLVGAGGIMETSDPKGDIAKMLQGKGSSAIEVAAGDAQLQQPPPAQGGC